MPLLDIAESKKITILASIEETTAKNVDLYAAFTKGTPDDVVNAALDYIFAKDKDFQKFTEAEPAAKPKTALRVKRPASAAVKSGSTNGSTKASSNGAR